MQRVRGQNKGLCSLLTGVSAIAGAAAAQPAPQPPAAPQVAEVVITGSRVITNGNASPTPQTVVSAAQIVALQPGPIAEAIANLPVFAGSKGLASNPGTGVTNSAANALNLRFLSSARTLVLVDGHRIAPSTYDQIIDVDAIPQILLQRVDTVTGGVSAVYGSDAVAGVVNFVNDPRFVGLKAEALGGMSTYNDERRISAGLAIGKGVLNDKGHVEFSYEYYQDPGVLDRFDRKWGSEVRTTEGLGTAAAPYHLVTNTRFTAFTFGGLISATGAGAALNGKTFAQNGVLSPFVNGIATGSPAYQSGGSGAYYNASIKDALTTNRLFARFDYDLSKAVHAYAEGSTTRNHTLNDGVYNQISGYTFSGANAFLPAAYQFNGTFKMSELIQQMPRVDTNTHQKQSFFITGVDGKFGNDFRWNLAYSRSTADANTRNENNINNQRLSASLDAVKDGSGNIVCRAALTNSAYANCVPLNLFGPTAASPAALAYITQATEFTVHNALNDVSASLAGSPIKDRAGPVTFAISAEWRSQSFSVDSARVPTDLANCAGLTFNCTQGTTALWPDATVNVRTPVSQSVTEGALEANVPLVSNSAFAQDVSLNGAARYTYYSTSGSAWTWKVGLVWQVNEELKFRGTRSRDIRAPTLYDLLQPSTSAIQLHQDFLTLATVSTPVISGGNPNLTPEVGNTTTAGMVYRPAWSPRLSVSLDAYNIDVSNAIVSQTGYAPAVQTVCIASGGTAPLCQLQRRPGPFSDTSTANNATLFYVSQVNASQVKTYGADVEGNYSTSLMDHPLTVRALLTWQPHHVTATPGVPNVEAAGQGFAFALPRVRVNLFANYKINNWEFGLLERWRSPLSLKGIPAVVYSGKTTAPSTIYTNLNIEYHMKELPIGAADLYVNISNLFNVPPPIAAGASQGASVGTFGGFASTDDPIGRYFTIGIRIRH